MTQTAINAQIEALKRVTEEAMQSKESAIKFLVDAGIIRDEPKPSLDIIPGNIKCRKD